MYKSRHLQKKYKFSQWLALWLQTRPMAWWTIHLHNVRKSSKDYDVIVTSIYQLLYETRKISTSGVQQVALVINEVTVFIVHDAWKASTRIILASCLLLPAAYPFHMCDSFIQRHISQVGMAAIHSIIICISMFTSGVPPRFQTYRK